MAARSIFLFIFAALAGLPASAQQLLRPGETLIYSFRTAANKKAIVAAGPDDNYLVYRYGTDSRVEMQYPARPDTASWRKFTYSGIIRGVSFDNTGALDLNFLSFCNGQYRYIVYDMAYENTDYFIGVKVQDTATQKQTNIPGRLKTRRGGLYTFRHDDRVQQGDDMYEN